MTRLPMLALAVLAAVPAAGCSAVAAAPAGGLEANPPPPAGATCDATEAQQFIGRKASDAIGRSALAMSKARTLRWGGPDTAFTMDYREDRLNIVYDAKGAIERIYCG